MKITVSDIMKNHPCVEWTEEMIADKIGEGKTLLEISRLRGVEIADKIWCITRFLPDDVNRKFAIWCARQCKTNVPEIGLYIDAIEKFYFGKGTKDNMEAADMAADSVSGHGLSSHASVASMACLGRLSSGYWLS